VKSNGNADNSAQLFQRAEVLFSEKKVQEAIELLQLCDSRHPNSPDVLYALALCHAQLGDASSANTLCDTVIALSQDPRAIQLKTSLSTLFHDSASATMVNTRVEDIEIDPDRKLPAPVPVQPQSGWGNWEGVFSWNFLSGITLHPSFTPYIGAYIIAAVFLPMFGGAFEWILSAQFLCSAVFIAVLMTPIARINGNVFAFFVLCSWYPLALLLLTEIFLFVLDRRSLMEGILTQSPVFTSGGLYFYAGFLIGLFFGTMLAGIVVFAVCKLTDMILETGGILLLIVVTLLTGFAAMGMIPRISKGLVLLPVSVISNRELGQIILADMIIGVIAFCEGVFFWIKIFITTSINRSLTNSMIESL